MFMVYWVEASLEGFVPKSEVFEHSKMSEALQFTERLRKDAIEKGYRFITFCSENPDRVGKDGVDETDSTYDWRKRR